MTSVWKRRWILSEKSSARFLFGRLSASGLSHRDKHEKRANALSRLLPGNAQPGRRFLPVLLLALLCILSGCSAGPASSSRTADTSLTAIPQTDPHGKIPIGSGVAVPPGIDGFVLNEYNEALTANGYFYAAWTAGEPSDYVNSDGEEAALYDAQIYMIVYEGTDGEDAASRVAGWLAAAREKYDVLEERKGSLPGFSREPVPKCDLLSYASSGGSNPYIGGASAFASAGSTAFCVEVLHTPAWEGDSYTVLLDFLRQVEER